MTSSPSGMIVATTHHKRVPRWRSMWPYHAYIPNRSSPKTLGAAMLEAFPISARAAASDPARSRQWYEQKLDLKPEREDMGAWIAGSEEEWHRRTGRPMTAAELDRVLRRYPGDL